MSHHLVKSLLIADVVSLIVDLEQSTEEKALEHFYLSNTAKSLADDNTALYGESALYIFSLYEEEQKDKQVNHR